MAAKVGCSRVFEPAACLVNQHVALRARLLTSGRRRQ